MIHLNPDQSVVDDIRAGLKAKGGYCPCRVEKTEENRCICLEFRRQMEDPDFHGYCHCGLYYKD
ncbi:MAG: ferredoxin-thioredoxin reductase catalytic domain-containing protein [Clostridia bacterium]|nr:ferredoxin-thioredoxin reductase catalytic domain-containing protein [Clostridia bacterium]MDY6183991.1 ferredoxin-thioredoxin reductase catalytic domain-containing protein [Eubacteriales bacterium]